MKRKVLPSNDYGDDDNNDNNGKNRNNIIAIIMLNPKKDPWLRATALGNLSCPPLCTHHQRSFFPQHAGARTPLHETLNPKNIKHKP
jgi:hypothetical protein